MCYITHEEQSAATGISKFDLQCVVVTAGTSEAVDDMKNCLDVPIKKVGELYKVVDRS
jgi:hypothetical protein